MDSDRVIGPALPPHLRKDLETKKEIIGPCLPPHLRNKSEDQDSAINESYGPQLPPTVMPVENCESSDEETYGPVLPGQSLKTQIALEERALQYKIDQLSQADNGPTREEWMLELPEVKASRFGLGPRQFRRKAGPDMSDRSAWTDTPNTKASSSKEVDLRKEAELKEIRRRDKEQEKMAKKYNKRKQSLLEMHQKTKKAKKEDSKERRPFNRETDLQVNRFDDAQRKAVLKKAQLLDDRFSRGQSKYL